ncbi:MAG: DUF3108 domain-containing protein [Bacteroidales bacterium]|nr:DUF3108 domain-containing protein [Bacteroidales bacterium]
MKVNKTYSVKVALFAALMLFSPLAKAQDHPFRQGETLSYALHYKWGVINADVAQMSFTLQQAQESCGPCYSIDMRGNTSKFFDKFFKMRYVYQSKFTVDDISPVWHHRESYEGNYWVKNTYDWKDSGRSLHAVVSKSTRPDRDTIITSGTSQISDIVSLVYKIRSSDIEKAIAGTPLHFVTAVDVNVYDVTFRYVGKEKRKSSELGTFSTCKFALDVKQRKGGEDISKESAIGISSDGKGNKGSLWFWLSDDAARVPLFFQVSVAVGNINGRIISMNGTKVPVTPIQ